MLQLERSVSEQHDIVKARYALRHQRCLQRCSCSISWQFRQQYPEIRFEINSSYTNFNLNHDDIDIAFCACAAVEWHDHETIDYLSTRFGLTPSYLSQFGRPTNVSDLSNHQCLATLHPNWVAFKIDDIDVSGWLSSNDLITYSSNKPW